MLSPILTTGAGPKRSAVSGVYERRDLVVGWGSATQLAPKLVETVRLDIDGWYPQKMASGSFSPSMLSLSGGLVEWAASITETSPGVWEGPFDRKWGDTQLLPHANIRLIPPKGYLAATPAELTVTFYGGAPDVTRHLRFASPYFRTAEIEWDTVEGATRVTHINTGDHPKIQAITQIARPRSTSGP